MKTATSAFLTKLYKIAGEQPVILAKIYYSATSFFLCSTERIKLSSEIYEPYVVHFGTFRMEIDESVFLAPPNEIDITLVRNSTTANLLDRHVIGEKIQLWQTFNGLNNFSDALPFGTYIIRSIENIEQGQFTVHCTGDEFKFIEEIPHELLNKTDYPKMAEGIEDVPWPLVLGDLRNPIGSEYRYLDTYKMNAGISHCVDKGTYKFLTYRHLSVGQQYGGVRAYQFEETDEGLNATIEYYDEQPNWTEETGNYYRIADIKPYDASNKGYARALRLLPTKPEIDNQVSNWEKAVDLDRDTVANLWLGEMKLALTFRKIESIGHILPSTESNYFIVKVALNIDYLETGGTVTVRLYYFGGLHISETFSSAGYHISSSSYGNIAPLNLSGMTITAEVSAGHTAEIDGFHIWLVYWSEADISKTDKRNKKAPRRRGLELSRGTFSVPEKREPESKLSKIFVEGVGPADQSGQGWNYKHPISILYFILNKMCLVPSSEIDIGGWNTLFSQMGINWEFAIGIADRINPKELLETCLHESQLKMWRDVYNKYRLFRVNTAGGVDMAFSDKKGNVYIMEDFRWGYSDAFYNKFELKYKWSPAKNEYQELYLKDKDNDADLQSSYVNYSNVESPYPTPEFEFVRDESVMDLIYPILKKAWMQLRIWIEFKTSLVGCLLEYGDTIRVNHSAQTWTQNSKDFQVIGLNQDNNRIWIKAIEIIP